MKNPRTLSSPGIFVRVFSIYGVCSATEVNILEQAMGSKLGKIESLIIITLNEWLDSSNPIFNNRGGLFTEKVRSDHPVGRTMAHN